uniref:RIIa domain-containing protein n=1 Tax=Cyanoderma ruficeps TaxID=181631 RepID=A0A8C3QIQ4_9PASS
MSIAYSNTNMRVPAGFRNLLEGLAREVLREQPTNLVAFAAQYFQKLLEQREGDPIPTCEIRIFPHRVVSKSPPPKKVGFASKPAALFLERTEPPHPYSPHFYPLFPVFHHHMWCSPTAWGMTAAPPGKTGRRDGEKKLAGTPCRG